MSVWKWADWLPQINEEFRVSLGEGATPLVRSRHIGPRAGLDLWFKMESGNPTGSYKDRFAALAVSQMRRDGARRCIATSSGNTGAALAAYCAAAALPCEIAIVETAPDGKLQQMQAYAADIYRVRGFGTDAEVSNKTMNRLRERDANGEGALQISAFCFSPVGMAGVQTIGYEIAEAGRFDHVFVPAGGGGLTLAVARGFRIAEENGMGKSPRIECAQPAGNDTIASPLRNGETRARAVECSTKISGLQVASVLDGDEVVAACRASGGSGHIVSDEETWAAQKMLAQQEGVFSEPAGAVALAAALRARSENRIAQNARVVCIVTGSGFKDEASLRKLAGESCGYKSADEI